MGSIVPVVLTDLGLVVVLLGVVSLARPIRFLGVHTRARAAGLAVAGCLVSVVAALLPAPETVVQSPQTALDRVTPAYQFSEVHSVTIRATPARVYQAITAVSADEILFFHALIWIRRFGQPGPESILNAPYHRPLLDVATRTTFASIVDSPQEIVVGTVVLAPPHAATNRRLGAEEFLALRGRGGFALAAMNFAISPGDDGTCVVTTETRVYATDAWTRRRFAAYWRVIYPGSAFIRRMWLRAIQRRAEAA